MAIREWRMLLGLALLMILVSQAGAQGPAAPPPRLNGLGKPYNLDLGAYQGGHGWSYAESYGYGFPFSPMQIPWTAVYPYSLPYFSPRMQGPWNNPGLYYRYGAGRYGPFATPPGLYNPACAMIALTVPPQAEVWVDGNPTRQAGGQRLFASPPLNPGQNYLYVLRVRWMENGQPVEQMKTVNVQGGEKVELQIPSAPR